MVKKAHWLYTIILAICILFPPQLFGVEAQISDVLIENNARYMSVYARLANSFTKDMDTAILAGVPATFTFYLDVYQRRSWWFDKRIASAVVQHTIKYDQVKKVYSVASSRTKQTSSFQDFQAAKEAMADLSGIEVVPVSDLTKSSSYYLKIKAKLKKVQLPLHMEYIFFFVSLWDFETPWHVKEFALK